MCVSLCAIQPGKEPRSKAQNAYLKCLLSREKSKNDETTAMEG